jgi:hypothetical protein
MTNFSLKLLAILALLHSSILRAEDRKSYCIDLVPLSATVKDCQQNVFYVRAARACVAKLEKEIATQQSLLSAAMLLAQAAAADSQSARIDNSVQDLSRMQSTLESLEAEAKQARADLKAYGQVFTYAGPLSPAFAKRFHMESFLQRFPCFSENQSLLGDEIKGVEQRIADLDKGAKAAAQMAGVSRTNLQKLDASSTNGVAHGRATASVPAKAVPTGAVQNGASSITGTEKAREDESKAIRLIDKKP